MISSHTTPYGSSPEDYGERVYNQPDPDARVRLCDAYLCKSEPHPLSNIDGERYCAPCHLETLAENMRDEWPGIEEQAEYVKWKGLADAQD
jgi:hypothetical protein